VSRKSEPEFRCALGCPVSICRYQNDWFINREHSHDPGSQAVEFIDASCNSPAKAVRRSESMLLPYDKLNGCHARLLTTGLSAH
jgi:hypothetical protein